jgi:hypothetical protein
MRGCSPAGVESGSTPNLKTTTTTTTTTTIELFCIAYFSRFERNLLSNATNVNEEAVQSDSS